VRARGGALDGRRDIAVRDLDHALVLDGHGRSGSGSDPIGVRRRGQVQDRGRSAGPARVQRGVEMMMTTTRTMTTGRSARWR
jgi:hypothetical protein